MDMLATPENTSRELLVNDKGTEFSELYNKYSPMVKQYRGNIMQVFEAFTGNA